MLIHDWKNKPLRYDPSRGYSICESCWNGQHWDPPYDYYDKEQKRWLHHQKVWKCKGQGCQCGCGDKGPKKIKFTGEGQTEINVGTIEIK